MTLEVNELIGDPLFQLNALLWLTQPLPHGDRITPLFYQHGFTVYAIAPLLPVPLDLRLVGATSRDSHEGRRKAGRSAHSRV